MKTSLFLLLCLIPVFAVTPSGFTTSRNQTRDFAGVTPTHRLSSTASVRVGSKAVKCKNFVNCLGGRCTMRETTCKSGEVCFATGGQPHGCIAEKACLKLKKQLSQYSKLTVVCCKNPVCNL